MPEKMPPIPLEHLSERELLIITIQNQNIMSQVQLPAIEEKIDNVVAKVEYNSECIADNKNVIDKVKWQSGINGDSVSTGQKIKFNIQSYSGIFVAVGFIVYGIGKAAGWWA